MGQVDEGTSSSQVLLLARPLQNTPFSRLIVPCTWGALSQCISWRSLPGLPFCSFLLYLIGLTSFLMSLSYVFPFPFPLYMWESIGGLYYKVDRGVAYLVSPSEVVYFTYLDLLPFPFPFPFPFTFPFTYMFPFPF